MSSKSFIDKALSGSIILEHQQSALRVDGHYSQLPETGNRTTHTAQTRFGYGDDSNSSCKSIQVCYTLQACPSTSNCPSIQSCPSTSACETKGLYCFSKAGDHLAKVVHTKPSRAHGHQRQAAQSKDALLDLK